MAQRATAVASTGMVWLHSVAPHQKHNLPSANAMQDLIVMMHNSLMSRKLHLQAGFGCTCLKSQLTLSEFNAGLGDDVPHRDVPTVASTGTVLA